MVRLALAVLVASAALAAQSRPADDKAFPNTKPFGRATIQFQDNTIHMVALYDYSQRNHDGAWLLLQTGVAVKKRTTVNRGNFHIEMPDGRTVPLPSQEVFLADSAQITKVRQNARIFDHDGQPMLEDLGSTNGSFLNGNKVAGTKLLHPGDRVQIGYTVLEAQ